MIRDPSGSSLSQSDFNAFCDIDKILYYIARWFDDRYWMNECSIVFKLEHAHIIHIALVPNIANIGPTYDTDTRLRYDIKWERDVLNPSPVDEVLAFHDHAIGKMLDCSYSVLVSEPDSVERLLKHIMRVVDADLQRKIGDT